MTPPRYILPGQLCFVTWHAVARTFRFLPTRRVTQILTYSLAVMAERYGMQIHEVMALSNHIHLCVTDTHGRLPDFMRDLNSLIARSLNALRGTSGTVIEKGYNLVEVADPERAMEHCIYTLANPVAADLVRRAKHWTGLSSRSMRYGRPIQIRRPSCAMWSSVRSNARRNGCSVVMTDGPRTRLPAEATLVLTRPPLCPQLSDEALRCEILKGLDRRERELMDVRRAAGRTVCGMKVVLGQHYSATPETAASLFGTTPKVSARSKWARAEALARNARFVEAYRQVRSLFVAGQRDARWPMGTWLMYRLHACPTTAGPP